MEQSYVGAQQQRGQAGQRDDPEPRFAATQGRVQPRQQEHAGLHHRGRVQVGRHRRGRGHRVRQPEVERELRALGEAAQQHQHQRRNVKRMFAQQIARPQHHIEVGRADDVADQQHAGQQAQPARAGHRERHARAFARVGLLLPVTDQQERAQAGEFPEHHQQDQVVSQHHAQHGAHEQQQEQEEARRWILGGEVVAGVQHDQRTDAGNQQREQPRQAIHAKAQLQAQHGQPVDRPAQHLAAEHRGRRGKQPGQHQQRHGACQPRGGSAPAVVDAGHQRSTQEGRQRKPRQ